VQTRCNRVPFGGGGFDSLLLHKAPYMNKVRRTVLVLLPVAHVGS